MRRVDRASIAGPASLTSAGRAGPNEVARALEHFGPPCKEGKFTFAAYKGDDVRHSLEALFHGKCAYCESRYDVGAPVDIEHFRPKGGVEGIVHPGYWWFAADWTNLLPSCIDCNRRRFQPTPSAFASLSGGLDQMRKSGFEKIKTGKETCFPIAEGGVRIVGPPPQGTLNAAILAEKGLLLDPCRHDPALHLAYHIDRAAPLSIVYPTGSADIILPLLAVAPDAAAELERSARAAGVSVAGAVSIQTYGLNRLALVQERTRLLRKLEFLGTLVLEMSAIADALETIGVNPLDTATRDWAVARLRANVSRSLAEIRGLAAPEAPFSEMVKAWIAIFKRDAADPPPPPDAPAGLPRRPIQLDDG